jgi:hypothetical protein
MDIQEMIGELREERAFLDEARHTMARTAHGSGTAVDMLSQKCDALQGGRSASIFTAHPQKIASIRAKPPFKSRRLPHPPQTQAAHFKWPYRKCPVLTVGAPLVL